jgi:SRSO17 transposase
MQSDSQRFDRYIDAISDELGHADRIEPFPSVLHGI